MSEKNNDRWWNRIDSPRTGRRAFRVLSGVCVILALSGLFFHPHVHYRWEAWFAFYGIAGFLSYFFIVVAARALRKGVMRDEDYYDRGDE